MSEPGSTSDAAAAGPDQAGAQVQLDAILNDKTHPYNVPGHHRWEEAAAEVLALRRASLGAENRPVVEYRDEPDALVPGARVESAPLSALYGREEFLSGFAGDVSVVDRTRTADVVQACGLTFFEGQQLLNATEGPVPDPADELDLEELWGDAVDDNVRAVKRVLTRLLAVDRDLHDKLLPFIQRRGAVANRVLAIAQRLGR